MAWKNLYSISPRLRRIMALIVPRPVRSVIRVNYIMMLQLGHLQAVRTRQILWKGELPCPWFTYPAVEYLEGLDFKGKKVFEYGSGYSSMYWVRVGAELATVDHDPRWHGWLKSRLPSTAQVLVETDYRRYVDCIDRFRELDVVVIDGAWRDRCALRAVENLNAKGMIILDNSDWFPDIAAALRTADFLQIDFHGFALGQDFRGTTSIFLKRGTDFKPRESRQPLPPIGGMPHEETWRLWPQGSSPHDAVNSLPPPVN